MEMTYDVDVLILLFLSYMHFVIFFSKHTYHISLG